MIFTLDVMRARKGDCLMVHYGTPDDPGLILIDGGPSQVYKPYLRPRIAAIRKARGLSDQEKLHVDMMMVSHIDDDHIVGLLDLMEELSEQKQGRKPWLLKPRSVWYNGFDKIIGNAPDELKNAVTAAYGAAALGAEPEICEDDELDEAAAMVLAGVAQGYRLHDYVRELGLNLNAQTGGKLVTAVPGAAPICMGRGLSLTIVGPMQPELRKLQAEFDAWLKKQDEKPKTKSALAAFTDSSVANLSSIVALAELGGKTMLLTGDARGDKIIEGLDAAGRLPAKGPLHVGILKVPHHGSDRNMCTSFFERVWADHYVFSGNGEHGNPERGTLEMLIEARGTANYRMYFTYPIDQLDEERRKEWEKQRARETTKNARKPGVQIRAPWDQEKQSIAELFKSKGLKEGQSYFILGAQDHSINLLDPITF